MYINGGGGRHYVTTPMNGRVRLTPHSLIPPSYVTALGTFNF